MSLLQKVNSAPFICKIALDFNGSLTATAQQELQNFFNSTGNQYTWKDLHFGKKNVSFRETEKQTKAGPEFTQTLRITLPISDSSRTDRIAHIKKAKFIRIELSNGNMLVMGRNDYYQNKLPIIKVNTDHKSATINITTKTIFSLGYLEINNVSQFVDFLIPTEVPNTLISV